MRLKLQLSMIVTYLAASRTVSPITPIPGDSSLIIIGEYIFICMRLKLQFNMIAIPIYSSPS
jgi:hypothetical protein